MIDLNAHVLPIIDKGYKTTQESILMAKRMVKLGITEAVSAPNFQVGKKLNKAIETIDAVKIFNQILKEQKIDLTIFPSQTIQIKNEEKYFFEDILSGNIIGINENLKYIEFDLSEESSFEKVESFFEKALNFGIKPILIGAEKNKYFLENFESLEKLIKKGALVNLSVGSILNKNNINEEKLITKLIKNEMVSVISSNATRADSGNFDFKEAYKCIKKISNKKYVKQIKNNIESIINGDDLIIVE